MPASGKIIVKKA